MSDQPPGPESATPSGSQNPAKPGGGNPPPANAPAPPRRISPRVKIGLAIAGCLLLLFGVIFGLRWLLHGRYMISTDDAYLRADLVTVAPRVSGYIDEIYVAENQKVAVGQPLLRIDLRNYRDTLSQQNAAVDARMADIESAQSQIRQQQAGLDQQRAQLAGAQAKTSFARQQAERYKSLRDQGAETDEHYDQAASDLQQAEASEKAAAAAVTVAERQLGTLRSQLQQAQAQLESARASANTAQVNLDDTLVRASIAGVVGDDTARLGQFVQPGTRLMSLVPVQSVYLVGNFKETQLKRIRIGQPATVTVDALGGATIDAKVASFSPGTGAQFALLPPENATGNFIKIVQRIPVRFSLMPSKELAERLIPGLSVTVEIDTTGNERSSP